MLPFYRRSNPTQEVRNASIKANIPAKLQEAVDLNIPVNMRVSTQVNMVFRR